MPRICTSTGRAGAVRRGAVTQPASARDAMAAKNLRSCPCFSIHSSTKIATAGLDPETSSGDGSCGSV
jgi:hypothetical protein